MGSNHSAVPPGSVVQVQPLNGQASSRQGLQELRITPRRAPKRSGRGIIALLSVILVILIIFAGVRFSIVFSGANDQLRILVSNQQAVTLDLRQHSPISPYLLGTAVFPREKSSSLDEAFDGFMPYTAMVINSLQSMKMKLLRYPGGEWGEEHVLSLDQLKDYSSLLIQTKTEGLLQAHLAGPVPNREQPGDYQPHNMTADVNSRANLAGRWVDYMNNPKSDQRTGAHKKDPFHPVKFWTVGNEPDRQINPMTGAKYTVAEYVNAFIQFSKIMHQNDPNIKVLGPEISQFYGIGAGPFDAQGHAWMDDFLKGVADYERSHPNEPKVLDGVSFHRYQFGDGKESPAMILGASNEWDYLLTPLRERIKIDFGRDIPVAVTEVNTNPGKTVPSPGVAALWWADTLGMLMNHQVEYVAFFSAAGVDRPYPLFVQGGLRETQMARVMQLFARLQSNVVPVSLDRNPVSIYATQDDARQAVSLLLINKSQTVQSLQIDPLDSFLNIGSWHSQHLILAPYSIAVVTLNRNGGAEASSFSVPTNTNATVGPINFSECGKKSDPLDTSIPC